MARLTEAFGDWAMRIRGQAIVREATVPGDPILLRHWYFACNGHALRHAFDQIRLAVLSAKKNTRLKPFCLVDTSVDSGDVSDRLRWLEAQGVTVIPHRATLFELVRRRFDAEAEVFSGHWLRCDTPLIETRERFVLYTDIDVMFRHDVSTSSLVPRYMACAPEFDRSDESYFNSGVMIMNVEGLRRTRRAFEKMLRRHLPFMAAHDDQRVLNATYRDAWARLPDGWNWKPYWGLSNEAPIVHFHGPKPTAIQNMLTGDIDRHGATHAALFRRDPQAYAAFLAEAESYLMLDGI